MNPKPTDIARLVIEGSASRDANGVVLIDAGVFGKMQYNVTQADLDAAAASMSAEFAAHDTALEEAKMQAEYVASQIAQLEAEKGKSQAKRGALEKLRLGLPPKPLSSLKAR